MIQIIPIEYLLSWFKIRIMRILFVFVFLSSVAFGQNDEITSKTDLKKNNLSANVGTAILFHDVGIKYQRIFSHKKIYSVLTVGQDFLREDFFNREDYFITSIKYGVITRSKNPNNPHHFEINTGIGFIHNKVVSRNGISYNPPSYGANEYEYVNEEEPVNERNYFSLIGNLGYRYQSVQKPIVFNYYI